MNSCCFCLATFCFNFSLLITLKICVKCLFLPQRGISSWLDFLRNADANLTLIYCTWDKTACSKERKQEDVLWLAITFLTGFFIGCNIFRFGKHKLFFVELTVIILFLRKTSHRIRPAWFKKNILYSLLPKYKVINAVLATPYLRDETRTTSTFTTTLPWFSFLEFASEVMH